VRRSIRATLLLWLAAVLSAALLLFGGLVYGHRHRTAYERLEAELSAHADAIASCVEWEAGEGFDLEQAEAYVRRLAERGDGAPVAVVRSDRGHLLLSSSGAPGAGERRQVVVAGPRGTSVVVSQNTTAVRADLSSFLAAVVATGAVVLLVAFAGGFLLAGRVLSPIRRMTETAERIAGGRRGDRIDVTSTETELGRLGRTLNGAFDGLEAALDQQSRFTADASHELRTPLSIVVSNAEHALRRDRPPEELRAALETCLRAARRMGGVVEGLLTLARSDVGELDLYRETVDLRTVVADAADTLRVQAEPRKIEFTLPAESLSVLCDPALLRTAVGNLISNAVRYNRDGGRVTVSLATEGEHAVLEVADTGAGIPAKDLPHVFERFFRVDAARSREAGGSGLGLPISEVITKAHGGSLSLRSVEDEGTIATMRLPLSGSSAPSRRTESRPDASSPSA
jgi:heavy metal sensor kinase